MSAPKIFSMLGVIRATGLSRSQILSGIKAGSFPEPFKLGKKLAWFEHTILIWLDERLENAEDAA